MAFSRSLRNTTHTWLPYKDRHMDALACESCHVPHLYSPAVRTYDWTVLNISGDPNTACRGVEGEVGPLSFGYLGHVHFVHLYVQDQRFRRRQHKGWRTR